MFAVEHINTALCRSKSSRVAERFIDTFESALRKLHTKVKDEVALQRLLRVYRVSPNPNTPVDS